MVDFGANDMMPHFIYCYGDYFIGGEMKKLKEIILRKMGEYGIQSSLLTILYMQRSRLITKEKSKLAAEGKLKNDPEWGMFEGSINDDLDSFINNLQNSNEIRDENVWSFFLSKLTKEELKLVEEKNQDHMRSYLLEFGADVDVKEMKKSDSNDKYVHCWCRRDTLHLTLELNQTQSKDEPSNDLRSSSRKRRCGRCVIN